MNEYTREQVEIWRVQWESRLEYGPEQIGYAKKSRRISVRCGELPKDDNILLCACDGWWPGNFGGIVSREPGNTAASVTVFID